MYQISIRTLAFLCVALSGVSCSNQQVESFYVNQQVQSFYVENASLADMAAHRQAMSFIRGEPSDPISNLFAVTGHRIGEGMGMVFAYRVFNTAEPIFLDSESFRKFTINIPNNVLNAEGEISLAKHRDIVAFWSDGASSFPGKSGCYGYAKGGSIRYDRLSDSMIWMTLDLDFDVISPRGWKGECGEFSIREVFEFSRIDLGSLTTWQGRPGDHIYDESMPHDF